MSLLRVLTALSLIGVHCAPGADRWIPAIDAALVKRSGSWSEESYRRASTKHLATQSDGAALDFGFSGPGLMLTLDAHGLPFAHLGTENLGLIEISIDGAPPVVIHPQREDRDVVVARGLEDRAHAVRVVHRAASAGAGVRIVGFRVLRGDEGELSVLVHGEASRFLTDARAVLSLKGKTIASRLVRKLDEWSLQDRRDSGRPRLRTRTSCIRLGAGSNTRHRDCGAQGNRAPAAVSSSHA